jgi:hypothetical protein
MAIDKLSVSMDESLTQVIRDAAADEGLSVSAWLSAAAQDRVRNRLLRLALDADAEEFGAMSDADIDRLVREARETAIVTDPRTAAA